MARLEGILKTQKSVTEKCNRKNMELIKRGMVIMNLYKKTEHLLYSYKTLSAEIKNISLEIEEIKNDYIGCSSITYEEKSSPTNKFNSSVENEAISREKNIPEQVDSLNALKRSKEIQIEKINNALESLDERSAKIVKMKYFNKVSNKQIARVLDLTEQTICDLKSKIINSMINLILIKY